MTGLEKSDELRVARLREGQHSKDEREREAIQITE